MKQESRLAVCRTVGLLAFCAIWATPMIYIVFIAFHNAVAQGGVFVAFTFRNFAQVFADAEFLGALLNSLIIGILSTIVIVVIATPAAYICAVKEFRGRQQIESWILSTRMLPPFVVVLPYFLLFRKIGLQDTILGLVIMHVIVSLALAFFMLRSFFAELPRDILEAALMEGAGEFLTLSRVALPQVRSGLAATAILVFIFSWNELAFAFTLAGGAVKTGPVAIFSFMGFQNVQIGPLMAAATLLVLPIAILLIISQKSLVRGLSFGAIKA
jgi:multiple sugar transport system permease protein